MSKEKRDAERASRRARRLAERAEERARRKERHAERAAERAERLAERVQRRPSRERDLEQSIEDLVDEVTAKAEQWIGETTQRLRDPADDKEIRRAEKEAARARQEADKARASADRAGHAADQLSEFEEVLAEEEADWEEELDDYEVDDRVSRKARRKARRARRKYGYGRMSDGWHWKNGDPWARARRRRSAHLYRDRQRKKICGVCAGLADYWGRPAWEIRLYAVLGMVFFPQVTFPSYFILYFLMDDKPYYRRVTDRFEETMDRRRSGREDKTARGETRRNSRNSRNSKRDENMASSREPKMNNVQAMKTAREKFSDIEQRLRDMETHVTSSRFELQRELKKISGDDQERA